MQLLRVIAAAFNGNSKEPLIMICNASLMLRIRILKYFFFSSRRRHTSSLRDWSSDVCSSDLLVALGDRVLVVGVEQQEIGPEAGYRIARNVRRNRDGLRRDRIGGARRQRRRKRNEIGRASCREREYISIVGAAYTISCIKDNI